MTLIEYISILLHMGLALILFWIFFFYLWRQYRIDVLRERLFEVRGNLFDYAASGAVSFDSPAYAKLRVVINSMIRFAHRFTFSRFVIVILFRKVFEALPTPAPLADWEKAVAALPEDQQKPLRDIHDRMMNSIMWHIISGSPILLGVFLVHAVRILASGRVKQLDEVREHLPVVEIVEVQAVNAQLDEEECLLEAAPA